VQLLNKLRTKHRSAGIVFDIACGGVASLALPPFFILPALFFLGLPVWRVIHANSRFEAAGIFGTAGLGWFLASTFWVSHALIVSTPSLWFLTPFVALALAIILAVFWAFAAAASWLPNQSAVVRLMCLLAMFGIIEWSRGFVVSGFPWSLMGGIFAIHLSSLQMASIIGIYGLTLLAFGFVVAPLLWVLSARRLALILLMLPVFGTLWGNLRLGSQPAAPAIKAPVVRLVQPAVPQHDKWNRQKRPVHLANLIDLSQAGCKQTGIL
jgi:Apolipoprotein N-acyltransferase